MKPRSKSEWITPAAFGRGVAGVNRPRAHFLFARGEIGPQAEQMIRRADQRADAGFTHAEFLQKFLRLRFGQINQVAFDLRADDHGFAGEMVRGVVADFQDERIFVRAGQIAFLHVARKNRRLVGHQPEQAGDGFFFRREFERERGLAEVQVRLQFFQHGFLRERFLVAALGVFGDAGQTFLHGLQIGKDQFGGDGFDVAHRINVAGDVVNVGVLETAHDLHDGVHFADVRQKFVAQTLARRLRL